MHNSKIGVGRGPVDKAPGCCKVALGSNPQPSTPKMGSSKVDEQPTGGPTKIHGKAVELALRNAKKKGAAQLSRVQRSSEGCSAAQQGAA